MIILDTGVCYAAADRDDPDHTRSRQILIDHAGQLSIPTPAIVETAWLIEDRLGPASEAGFLASVVAGELTRVDLTDNDWARVHQLVVTYADLRLGLVDASVVTIAERLNVTTVATLNHRDFTVVRPTHTEALTLIP